MVDRLRGDVSEAPITELVGLGFADQDRAGAVRLDGQVVDQQLNQPGAAAAAGAFTRRTQRTPDELLHFGALRHRRTSERKSRLRLHYRTLKG